MSFVDTVINVLYFTIKQPNTYPGQIQYNTIVF